MRVNLKGAAQNTLDGVKNISDIVDNYDGEVGEEAQDIIDQINDVMVKCQPQLGAFCMLEYFKET